MGHSRQIQQVFGIDVLRSSSNFYQLMAFMTEVLSEKFSLIAQFSLTLLLFKVYRLSKSFWFANFFDFQDILTSESFCCKPFWSYFLNLDQE